MSDPPELGERREVRLPAGTIRYHDRGNGPAIVFVHPMIVNGAMWRKMVPLLADRHRCITPDWPLGGHSVPMEHDADLTPPGLAALIASFLEALDLREVTLVGNDTGGAIAQLVATRHPDRLARLVVVTTDAFDNFPPPMGQFLQRLSYVPGVLAVAVRLAALPGLRRLPVAFGWLAKRPIEPRVVRAYLRPSRRREIRRDGVKALRALNARYTMETAAELPSFGKPVLVAWNPEDRFFPYEHAERLAAIIPGARLVAIDDSYTFVPEDQPRPLAEAIADFIAATPAR